MVRGNIPLNISLVMLTDLRGISPDARALALHARGGGTDASIFQKRADMLDFEEKTFLFFSCVVWYSPIRKMVCV